MKKLIESFMSVMAVATLIILVSCERGSFNVGGMNTFVDSSNDSTLDVSSATAETDGIVSAASPEDSTDESVISSSVSVDISVVDSTEESIEETSLFKDPEGSNVSCWLQVTYIENTSDEVLQKIAMNCDEFIVHIGLQYQQPEILRELKKLNPQIKLLAYFNPMEMFYQGGSYGQQPDRTLWAGIDDSNGVWWLMGSQNGQYKNIENWPGMWMLNMSSVCPVSGGRKYSQYFADMMVDIVDWELWDGVFLDNIRYDISWIIIQKYQGIDCLDYNNDGNCGKEMVSVDPNDPYNNQVDEWLREGTEQMLERITFNLWSMEIVGKIIIGNSGHSYYYDQGLLDGVCYEAALTYYPDTALESYQSITRGEGWNMVGSQIDMANLKTNKDEQRKLRFNTSFARLGNAYYAIDDLLVDHGQLYFDDVLKYKFGRLLDAFRYDSKTGLYSAEYELAEVFWNNTEKAAAVVFDQIHYLIYTAQMPDVYSGGEIMKITIPPQDGRIVFKESPEKRD